MDFQLITIPVETEGEFYFLLDKQGNRLFSKRVRRQRLDLEDLNVSRITWAVAIRKAISKLNRYDCIIQYKTPWHKKVDCLARSFSHRSRELKLPKSRSRFEQYPTSTWQTAILRMINQYRSRYVYHCESPWNRWAVCVCKNNNRRSMTRYGKNN